MISDKLDTLVADGKTYADPVELILDKTRRGGRVMRDLLRDDAGLCSAHFVGPLSEVDFSEKGIQRLLQAFLRCPANIVLALEGGEVKFENTQSATSGVGFKSRGGEEAGSFGPVGGKFDEGLGGEYKWWGGDR